MCVGEKMDNKRLKCFFLDMSKIHLTGEKFILFEVPCEVH